MKSMNRGIIPYPKSRSAILRHSASANEPTCKTDADGPHKNSIDAGDDSR